MSVELQIDGVDMSNVPSYVAQNLFRSGDGKVKISVMARNADEVGIGRKVNG